MMNIATAMETSSLHRLGLNKTKYQRSMHHQTGDYKSFASKLIQSKKKQSALPMKLSENPKSHLAHEAGEIKQNLNKPNIFCKFMLANAKGLLLAKEETSICVDTLALLISFPISSTAPETRRILERLSYLTTHKDHKICNLASALLHHWRQSIRDQQLTKMPVKLKEKKLGL
ncbi:hypothetical protein EUTSA_v10023971mg [Eutrema salsugineum]|uniref:TFIIS N-terminal domain-containing protein n=1 Tax=Eutrema salsugineum TaxID=72664 RepID=V4KQE5_EUTSA|nr:hypothetical protein EUTSA_v10023971mg [Eutrema salsugineum]